MTTDPFVSFFQWCLPSMGLRWRGFRRVRGQVQKRIRRRWLRLGLEDLQEYRAHLEACHEEWEVLRSLCFVTISRFYRDRGIFDAIREQLLPRCAQAALERGEASLRLWSAGCASGEEAYTLKLLWELELQGRFPELSCEIVATDAQEHMLQRAQEAAYPSGCLRELPPQWRREAFVESAEESGMWLLHEAFREGIRWLRQDLTLEQPEGPFALICCRNLAFTYFDLDHQRQVLDAFARLLVPGGFLVLGNHEELPEHRRFVPLHHHRRLYQLSSPQEPEAARPPTERP